MLNYILQQAQRFERRHGISPNVIYMNKDHFLELSEELPGLFCETPDIHLGFRIAILSKEAMSHPQVALIEQQKTVRVRSLSSQSQSVRH